jgi:release factor glutamine methyltransferase
MTIHEAHHRLRAQLSELYDDREAASIADMVIEYVSGQKKIDRLLNKEIAMTSEESGEFNKITSELLRHRPLQYVLHEAWFAGMKFYVDENVLIPRPETEELVEWIFIDTQNNHLAAKKLIDIGTGSGCIPITLKKKIPGASVKALDVSEGALNVAIKNAMLLGAQVYFLRMDFLDKTRWNDLGSFDIIVSNPPYVRYCEACAMKLNVLEHEPHLALFVPDDDPLLFYRHIAEFGKSHLEMNGAIFMEINESLSEDLTILFDVEGYTTELREDMQGKQRMLKATRRKQ